MSSSVRVDSGRMLELLGNEGQLLAAATHDAHPDALASGVPSRTLGETVRDAGDRCVDTLAWLGVEPRIPDLPRQATLRETARRFSAALAELLAEFGSRPPDDRCPTWWPEEHAVCFWLRRMLHVTVVYRVDVQTAAGVAVTPIEDDVALDGTDEVLRLWLGYRLNSLGITATRECSLAVRAAGFGWHVTATPRRTEVVRDDIAAVASDALITGLPADVYLWLWGRLPDRSLRVTGDHDAVAQLWGLLRLATQ